MKNCKRILINYIVSSLIISIHLLLFMLPISCGSQQEPKKGTAVPAKGSTRAAIPAEKPWKVRSRQGVVQFIYVEPEKAHDRNLMAQILLEVVGNKSKVTKPAQIMFFDKESETPMALPMTDSQILHQVAQYNYNPYTGFEEFIWLIVINTESSPPELATMKDKISPGLAR